MTLNLTVNMTFKRKMKVIFVFSVLNLTLKWVWRKSESVAEYVAEYVAYYGQPLPEVERCFKIRSR